MRRWAQNLGLLVASTLLAVVAAEVGLRLVVGSKERRRELRSMLDRSRDAVPESGVENVSLRGLIRASADEARVYELKPGLEARFVGVPVRINRDGFRERELATPPPAGTFRVVGLGDSQMFGWGVPAEATYLRVLEERLAARGDPAVYETVNLAVPGYNAAMEVATYRAVGRRLEPDLVLVGLMGNDVDLPNFMKRSSLTWPGNLFLYNLLVHGGAAMRDRARRLVPARWDPGAARLVAAGGVPEAYRWMVGPGAVAGAYRQLAALAAEDGARVVVFGDWRLVLDPAEKRALGRRHRFVFLDETEVRRTYERAAGVTLGDEELALSATDPHASVLGHRMRGEGLAILLAERGLLPVALQSS